MGDFGIFRVEESVGGNGKWVYGVFFCVVGDGILVIYIDVLMVYFGGGDVWLLLRE